MRDSRTTAAVPSGQVWDQLLCLLLIETSLKKFDTWTMEAPPEATSELHQNTCPFCGKVFKRVGNHLPHCKERRDRDYSAYLAKKTLDKRT